MLTFKKKDRGFSLAEVLIVIALLGILVSVVLLNLGTSDVRTKERALQSNLQAIRTAIDLYRSDHGRYPCSQGDYGYPCTDAELRAKLTYFTSQGGRTSTAKDDIYRFGPYLKDFPPEPFSGSDSLSWSLGTMRRKEGIATAISSGSGAGGWFYEPESGNVVANLGSSFSSNYASF